MSLNNMIWGWGHTPATFLILPMLGRHPGEYPRFRDCFIEDRDNPEYNGYIHVYTRTGGANRDDYYEENDKMRSNPNFIIDFDDPSVSTYASWIFSVPNKWKKDFELLVSKSDYSIIEVNLNKISEAYKQEIIRMFPDFNNNIAQII